MENLENKLQYILMTIGMSTGILSVVDYINVTLGILGFIITVVVGISAWQKNKSTRKREDAQAEYFKIMYDNEIKRNEQK